MARTLPQVVRELCLWFPGSEETLAHGMADFRVGGKTFATFAINHHGDGNIALRLSAPPGAQQQWVKAEPKHFFVPPYVGPRGWLGVRLDRGVSWVVVARLVREAWEKVAPARLAGTVGKLPVIRPSTVRLKPEEIDPLESKRGREVVPKLRALCEALPEVTEGRQFGNPVWRAGKKVFAMAWCYRGDGRLQFGFWVGVDQQALLVRDPQFSIPAYLGHNGWIAVDVSRRANWKEIRSLALFSYRHFAQKKMLKALGD